ncbi:MAG: hypothetical protein KAR40_09705 [Candidatus Sabulitectum sp.]|nr:hypothetical protein [Candidatus Sabulitectum sp.]
MPDGDGRVLRRADSIPRELEGLDPGELFTTRAPGQRGSLLQRRPGEQNVLLRGGPEGVGAFSRRVPEEGFAPVEETLAFVRGEGRPAPEEVAPGAPGAALAPEIGTPGWAKAELQKVTEGHKAQIDERDQIIQQGMTEGASASAIQDVLRSKKLHNLKDEPSLKDMKWLVEMSQEKPSTGDIEAGALQKWMDGEQLSEQEQLLVSRKTADPAYAQATQLVMQDPNLQFAPSTERLGAINELFGQIKAGRAGGTPGGGGFAPPPGAPVPAQAPTGGTRELDDATAQAILVEAGGDPDRARQIARERGYSFGG